jgi:hypothetical protein
VLSERICPEVVEGETLSSVRSTILTRGETNVTHEDSSVSSLIEVQACEMKVSVQTVC